MYLHTLRIQKVANRYRMQVLVFVDRSDTKVLLFRMLSTQNLLILLAKSPQLGFEVCMFLREGRCQNVDKTINNVRPARNELFCCCHLLNSLVFAR